MEKQSVTRGAQSRRLYFAWATQSVIIPAVTILILIAFTIAPFFVLPNIEASDTRGKPTLTTTARVVSVIYEQPTRGNAFHPDIMTIDINGQVVSQASNLVIPTGKRIHVSYKVGRSGRIYVQDIWL